MSNWILIALLAVSSSVFAADEKPDCNKLFNRSYKGTPAETLANQLEKLNGRFDKVIVRLSPYHIIDTRALNLAAGAKRFNKLQTDLDAFKNQLKLVSAELDAFDVRIDDLGPLQDRTKSLARRLEQLELEFSILTAIRLDAPRPKGYRARNLPGAETDWDLFVEPPISEFIPEVSQPFESEAEAASEAKPASEVKPTSIDFYFPDQGHIRPFGPNRTKP